MGNAIISRKNGISQIEILPESHKITDGYKIKSIKNLDFQRYTYIVNVGGETYNNLPVTDTFVIQHGVITQCVYGDNTNLNLPRKQTFDISIDVEGGTINIALHNLNGYVGETTRMATSVVAIS